MHAMTRFITFTTPGFLGGATGTSEWRALSLKGVLRFWWRVVHAQQEQFDVGRLREQEGLLWGHSWREHGLPSGKRKVWPLRGRVCISLTPVEPEIFSGTMPSLAIGKRRVHHPWLGGSQAPEGATFGREVDALLYLGYGPVTARGLKNAPAMQPGQAARLCLWWFARTQDEAHAQVEKTLEALNLFGCVGGKSRNGWGSLRVSTVLDEPPWSREDLLRRIREFARSYSRDLDECLNNDWCHALASSQGKLCVWYCPQTFPSWEEALQAIAEIKISVVTKLGHQGELPELAANTDGMESERDVYPKKAQITTRHILSYPVTNHGVAGWVLERGGKPVRDKSRRLRQNERLANQVRFKVHVIQEQGRRRLLPMAFHLAHRLPEALAGKLDPKQREAVRTSEPRVWERVYQVLSQHWVQL
ncbi:MAG: hypothetical protein N2447_08260 [Thermoanaerobaculum sp.]|nr:hypothetical protein [Thermoanaerobaculum sp.]